MRGLVRLGNRCWSRTLVLHLLEGVGSTYRRQSNRNQGGAVNDLEDDGQMSIYHLADVCHKKFIMNMFIAQPLSRQSNPERSSTPTLTVLLLLVWLIHEEGEWVES